ncbi:hypothetical protein Q8A67_022411 [Cirrhinus molitorella]|uniref:Uncharacterized protein n=1 Tax=Cirrhinus molitorella TaxID=172907 RepID=A0AA88P801_9TELE|nr:hypothetical protein Q8A67_022411 [Cirrhinus molitorella]
MKGAMWRHFGKSKLDPIEREHVNLAECSASKTQEQHQKCLAGRRNIAYFQYSDVSNWSTSQEGLFVKPPLNLPLTPSVYVPWRADENDQIKDQSVMEACLKRVNDNRNTTAEAISQTQLSC